MKTMGSKLIGLLCGIHKEDDDNDNIKSEKPTWANRRDWKKTQNNIENQRGVRREEIEIKSCMHILRSADLNGI